MKSSKNYFVFVEDLCAEEVIPDAATQQSISSDQSDDDNEDDTEPSRVVEAQTSERLLYHAAMSLKEIIQDKCKSTAKLPWPPTAQDLNIDTAMRMIPPELYNVIAWITGTTSEF